MCINSLNNTLDLRGIEIIIIDNGSRMVQRHIFKG
ncbi:hypothetical protein N752_18675 [Desulforamulus aquiferis]|nr:hypothetical protein N752_18675 [Desulforamulus aquiferis]